MSSFFISAPSESNLQPWSTQNMKFFGFAKKWKKCIIYIFYNMEVCFVWTFGLIFCIIYFLEKNCKLGLFNKYRDRTQKQFPLMQFHILPLVYGLNSVRLKCLLSFCKYHWLKLNLTRSIKKNNLLNGPFNFELYLKVKF